MPNRYEFKCPSAIFHPLCFYNIIDIAASTNIRLIIVTFQDNSYEFYL